jgi:hypothetical protein
VNLKRGESRDDATDRVRLKDHRLKDQLVQRCDPGTIPNVTTVTQDATRHMVLNC